MLRRLWHSIRGNAWGHYKTHGVLPIAWESTGVPTITPSHALRYTPVYRAATLIANDIARTKFDTPDSVVSALLDRPNRWQSGFEFRRSLTMQALLYGNAFAVINRTRGGGLLELLPCAPESVSLDLVRAEPFYRTTSYGEVPMSSMLHIRAPGLDGLWGESPINLCKVSLQVMAAQEAAQLQVMSNAGNPKIAFVHPGPLSEGARQKILEDYVAKHSGAINAGKPVVLAEGMRVERISSTLDDQGISAARAYSIEEVSRIYGVPTHLLGMAASGGAYGSLEWLGRTYVDGCIAHWLEVWRSELLNKLAGSDLSFDTDYLHKPALAEQFAALRTGVESGVITRNEARGMLDLAPLPGLDEPIVAKNMGTGGGTTNAGSDTSQEAGTANDF
jgi:HK97 family phage portal protein